MIKREKFAEVWHEEFSKEELYKKIETNKEILKQQVPNLTEEALEERALINTRLELKRFKLIPSTQFRGYILGTSDTVDMGTIRREAALKAYSENPEKATRENLVLVKNGDVVPIDNREFFDTAKKSKNRDFRKPLQDSFFKSIYGICKKNSDKEYRKFVMMLNNAQVKLDFSLNKPTTWRGRNNTQPGDDFYKINSNSLTQFDVSKDEDVINIDVRDEVIKAFKVPIINEDGSLGDGDAVSLNQLQKWHEKNKDDRNKIVAVEGFVVSLSPQPSEKGNYSILLDDESLSTDQIVGCTLKTSIYEKCSLSVNSKVLAFGSPFELLDRETNQPRILLSLVGVYTYPEYATPEPEKIEDESISPTDEENSDEEYT